MDNPPTVLEIAAQFRQALDKADVQAMKRLINAYRGIYRRLEREIMALLELAVSEDIGAGKLRRMERYKDLMAQVLDDLRDFQGITKTELEQAAQLGLQLGESEARGLLSTLIAGDQRLAAEFNKLPAEAIRQLVGFLDPGGALYQRLGKLAAVTADRVGEAIIEGVSLGRNPRVTARVVQKAFGMGLTDAMRNVRTAQIWAYREANRASWAANEDVVKGWQWRAALDDRTCPACLAMHGTVHPINEPLNGHYQCRCVAVPVIIGAKPLIEEGSGEKWLKAQNEQVQREVLGPKYESWKAGELPPGKWVGEYDSPVYGKMIAEASGKPVDKA